MDNNYIFPNMPVKERVEALSKIAAGIVEEEYGKRLTDDVIRCHKDEYSKEAIELQNLEAKKKAEVDKHSAGIKAHIAAMDERLELIKTGREKAFGKLFAVPNREKQTMNYYDETGELIRDRPLEPKEQQTGLFLDADNAADDIQDVEFEEVTEQEKAALYDEPEPEGEEPEEQPEEKPKGRKRGGKK